MCIALTEFRLQQHLYMKATSVLLDALTALRNIRAVTSGMPASFSAATWLRINFTHVQCLRKHCCHAGSMTHAERLGGLHKHI